MTVRWKIIYYCPDCKGTFDFLKYETEPHGEVFAVCPYCGEVPVNAVQCDICHEYMSEEYIRTKDGQTICSDCYTKHNILEEF